MNLQISLLSSTTISPITWDNFIVESPQGNVFALYGYMQIISPNWQAIIVKEEEKYLAVMPFGIEKKLGFSFALQPLISQHWGIFFSNHSFKNKYEEYSFYRKIVSVMIENLPKIHLFTYHFSPFFPYPLPFRQKGYQLTTRFTYHLSLEKTEAELWTDLASPLQRQIKKNQKQSFSISFNQEKDIQSVSDIFIQNQDTGKNLTGLGKNQLPQIVEKLAKIAAYFISEKKGILLCLTDTNGKVQAGGLFGLFGDKMTYIAGGASPEFRTEGLMSRLLWEAILYGNAHNYRLFDFEGSMIVGIESFFRKFGASPVPYLQISHKQLPFYLQWISVFKL